MNPDFWRGKRVLVTGHTGFKGSWLCLWLESLGAQVVGYALAPPTTPSLFDVAQVGQGLESHIGDVRDLEHLAQVVAAARPEIVFHLAAQPLVRYSYQEPVETYSVNVMGTVHLLEAVRRASGVKAVVAITTDKCYENREWAWGYRESDPMGGHDPYSSSKGCAELAIAGYRRSFFASEKEASSGVAVASARAGNVIGGGDWASDRLIPDMIRAFSAGQPVVIRNPHATRPWQHVLEPLRGYLMLAERLWEDGQPYAEGWNFGPSDEDVQPVGWIVQRLTDLWGEGAHWRLDQGRHPHEATFLKLDCSKAKAHLHWHPRWDLPTALERIVAWHKAFQRGEAMRAFTLQQISDYGTGSSR
ncbi:MAG: CDP-glucose 4,6-dehydratase [Firmicutes bacterium]|nr:CDP-glucose 4,6-dehydratase [Bacillota bacterium]